MGQYILGLSSGIRAGTLWLGFNLCCMIHLPLFVMDRGQFLIIPPLFDDTNYTYWKVRMRDFLQSLDEMMWQAVEIGWTKPTESSANWDDVKIKAANFNSKILNALFSAVTNKSSRRYSPLKLQSKYEPFSRQLMKEPRLSKIQYFKGLIQALKRLKWRRMSHSMSSMSSSRT